MVARTRPLGDDDVHEFIAERLADRGWCVVEGYLEDAAVAQLRGEALERWRTGGFHLATVGKDAQVHPEIRSDEILWLGAPQSEAQDRYLARMEGLRLAINRRMLLGLFDFECHYARYAPGAYYRRHRDRFRNDTRRAVSTVMYLNESWDAHDGGALRLFLDAAGAHDIVPRAGTLACFLSAELWHEVLPARRERLSLTGWFRTRP